MLTCVLGNPRVRVSCFKTVQVWNTCAVVNSIKLDGVPSAAPSIPTIPSAPSSLISPSGNCHNDFNDHYSELKLVCFFEDYDFNDQDANTKIVMMKTIN
jgi:hypothetical protein